jgi:hypothetical protein
LKFALAVAVLAAFSAIATAAPPGSHSLPQNDAFTAVAPIDPFPSDPGLNRPELNARIFQVAVGPAGSSETGLPVAATVFAGGTLLALLTVFLVSRRSLRHRQRHSRRVKRVYRTMAFTR